MTTNLIKTIRPFNQVGGFIKAVSADTFEGHLVRFNEPGTDDLSGEWFSKRTLFMQNMGYPIKGRPINYQHGMDMSFGNFPIGIYSFADEDEIGLFVRGQLHTLAEYEEMLRELGRVKGVHMSDSQVSERSQVAYKAVKSLLAGIPLRQSMGADIATYRVDEETGHIDQCGIVHGALTPTPADDKNPVVQFKSAWQYVTNLDNDRTTFLFKDLPPTSDTQSQTVNPSMVNPTSVPVATSVNGHNIKHSKQQENKLMAKKSLKEFTPEDEEVLRSVIKEVVLEIMGETGMEYEEEDVLAMTDEMEENLSKAEEDDDEMKADDGDEEDATKADDPVDEEEAQKRVSKHIASILPSAIKKHMQKQSKLKATSKKIAGKALEHFKDTAPAKSYKREVGGYQDNTMNGLSTTSQSSHITVAEQRKYAGLSAESMAVGLKIASSALFPHGVPQGTTLGDFVKTGMVSESYIRTMMHKAQPTISRNEGLKSMGVFDNMMDHDRIALKSVTPFKANELDAVAITNQGAEWAFIFYDTRLWERARHETQLFNMMAERGMRTADVTGKSMNVKVDTGSPTVYTAPEAQSIGADGRPEVVVQTTPFTTNEVQKDVRKHMLATAFTDELTEDSIIAIQQYLDQDVVTTLSEALEDVFINGDTTTTSSNINTDGTPATGIQTPLYIAFDGLRHNWLVDNTGQRNSSGSALTLLDYENTIMLLDPTIVNRRQNMLFVVDYKTESATRKLPELLTDDVKRSGGTAFAGQIAPLFSVPVYMSGFQRLSQADGTISATPGNNTKGTLQVVYAPYWQYGRKREVTIELERYAQSSSTVVVASVRHILAARGANASAGTYNITV